MILVTVALRLTQGTPWGRVLRAVREDEDAARALGKNAFAYKLQSLAISAAIASVAGWFLALDLATIHPDRLRAAGHLLRLLGPDPRRFGQLLGGDRRIGDPLDAARRHQIRGDTFQDESDTAALRFAIVGLVLILLMAFRPQGMFGKKEEMVLGD